MSTKRQVFYSFNYANDFWRVQTVKNIGAVEGNSPVSSNDWEQVKRGGDTAIKKWIAKQMQYRSCTVVLIGSDTANRKWINHEIIESWKKKMGVAGIYIYGLEGRDGRTSPQGNNPFDFISFKNGRKLSSIVKAYNPAGRDSNSKYRWISRHLSGIIEQAIEIRNKL